MGIEAREEKSRREIQESSDKHGFYKSEVVVINTQQWERRMHDRLPARQSKWRQRWGWNMIVEELYDALIEAGASEAKARAASRAIADMEGNFGTIRNDISRFDEKIRSDISRLDNKIEQKVSELRSYVDQRFTHIEGTQRLHSWMLGTMLAFIIALFFKQFSR